jgi:hypothetical protein
MIALLGLILPTLPTAFLSALGVFTYSLLDSAQNLDAHPVIPDLLRDRHETANKASTAEDNVPPFLAPISFVTREQEGPNLVSGLDLGAQFMPLVPVRMFGVNLLDRGGSSESTEPWESMPDHQLPELFFILPSRHLGLNEDWGSVGGGGGVSGLGGK